MTNSPIAIALQPRRDASVSRALGFAREYVSRVEARLQENGMDLNAAFPRPHARMSRKDYVAMKAAHDKAASLVLPLKSVRRRGEPLVVEMDQDRIAMFIEIIKADAASQFDAYVRKLENKVGKADSAEIDNAPLWNGSILTVRVAGEVQRWKTQMILNVSSLGTLFNQWPTRQVK
jgi:hypothetical protein